MWFLASLVTLPLIWTGAAGNQSRILSNPRNASLYSPLNERPFIPNSTTPLDEPPFIPNSTSPLDERPFIPNSTSPLNERPFIPNSTSLIDERPFIPNYTSPLDERPFIPNYTSPLDERPFIPNYTTPLDERPFILNYTSPLDERPFISNSTSPLDERPFIHNSTSPLDERPFIHNSTSPFDERSFIPNYTSPLDERSYIPNYTSPLDERPFIHNSTSSATYTGIHGEEFSFDLRDDATVTADIATVTADDATVTADNATVTADNALVIADNALVTADNALVTPYYKNRSHVVRPRIRDSRKLNPGPPFSKYSDKFLNLGNLNASGDNSISQKDGEDEEVSINLQPDGSFHSSQLRESMLGLSRSIVKLGLVGKCSNIPRRKLERSAAHIMDHVFLEGKSKNETNNKISVSWKENHPVSEMLQFVFNGLEERVEQCAIELSNVDYYNWDIMNMIASLDPEVIEFLSLKIMPVKEYFGVDSEDIPERSLPILENICRDALTVKKDELMLCLDDLSFLVKVIVTGALERSDDARRRYKRYAEVLSDAVSEQLESESALIRRDGYGYDGNGGDKGYYSKDYKDSPSYVIIPETGGYDYYYPLLLKFLSALALGTYGFLGLLCFNTFLSAKLLGGGPPGLKGTKGTTGIKGVSGAPGMKGVKGAVGPPGDKGVAGFKGVTGATGMTGATGASGPTPAAKGPPGMAGLPGPNGPKGPNGVQGDKGPLGPQGPTGDTGPKGPPGTGRKRRSVEQRHDYDIGSELLDSPQMLLILYQMMEEDQQIEASANLDVIQKINSLWKDYKNPPNCARCKLFEFLAHQDFESLEPYIIAGFSHILGASDSLQLLDDVREGKRRGSKMRCKRRKNTCHLEHLETH